MEFLTSAKLEVRCLQGNIVSRIKAAWPKDSNGKYMIFVGQIKVPGHIVAPWDYIMGEKIDKYGNYDRPLNGFSHGQNIFEQEHTYLIFRSAHAPNFGDMFDCAMVHSRFDANESVKEDKYIEAVKKAIPQYRRSNMEDNCPIWSDRCHTLTDYRVSMTLDLIRDFEWAGGFEGNVFDYIDSWREHFGSYGTIQIFGDPRSQQTPQRFAETRTVYRPRMMRPWLGMTDLKHDYTWQYNFCHEGFLSESIMGKVDGSCT